MIVRVTGGLGNQLFQYAFGRAVSTELGEELYLDKSSYIQDRKRKFELNKYNVTYTNGKIVRKCLCNFEILFKNHIGSLKILERLLGMQWEEQRMGYEHIRNSNRYLIGHWMNVRYFENIKENLQQELVYIGEVTEEQRKLINNMKTEHAVAMHVRRCDYLSKTCQQAGYINLEKKYYKKGIEYLKDNISGDIKLYVFSDDIEWCKIEYKDCENVVFVDSKISNNPHIDFMLMRNCKYFITANSTFSWWAAWLAEYENKLIIAPKKWTSRDDVTKLRSALLKDAILFDNE